MAVDKTQVRWRQRRRASEGGTVIVEAAIVLPVLFLLVFGAIEYGLLFKDDLTGSNVVRAGGRVLSAQANGATADQAGLQAMLPAAAALEGGLAGVTRIVVYYATCAAPDFTAVRPCDGDPRVRAPGGCGSWRRSPACRTEPPSGSRTRPATGPAQALRR